MGAHHFQLDIVPSHRVDPTTTTIAPGAIDEQSGWSGTTPSEAFIAGLRGLLPIDSSWGMVEEYRSNGTWGSDLRIWRREDGAVEGITFRYSPSRDPWSLMQSLLNVVREESVVLIARHAGVWLPPEEARVAKQLQTSSASQFIVDPLGAIISSAKRVPDDE